MLFLQLKSGEYLTIGEDITIQVFRDSCARIRVAVNAPGGVAVVRGEVRERNGEGRPEGLVEKKSRTPAQEKESSVSPG